MTPLAHRLLEMQTLPVWKRPELVDPSNVMGDMRGCHCFEITSILGLLDDLGEIFVKQLREGKDQDVHDISKQSLFLPAPKTWIEWVGRYVPGRFGALIIKANETEPFAFIRLVVWDGGLLDGTHRYAFPEIAALVKLHTAGTVFMKWAGKGWTMAGNPQMAERGRPALSIDPANGDPLQVWAHPLIMARMALIAINSPKIVNRVEREPHRGLQRELNKKFGPGNCQLHPWHEIKLEITKPREINDGEPHTDRVTGSRALHFCRKYIRIKRGKLEYVSAHWRGDPTKGVKPASYTVTP